MSSTAPGLYPMDSSTPAKVANPSVSLEVYSRRLSHIVLKSLEPKIPRFPADCCSSKRPEDLEMSQENTVNSLPVDLLADPRTPNLTKEYIDFSKTDLPELKGKYAVILDGVLTYEECVALIKAAEDHADGKWERAMVNIGNNEQILATQIRNCGRIIWDSHELGRRLWARIAPAVPELQELRQLHDVCGKFSTRRGEVFGKARLNERMRFLKYTGGEYFKGHCDGQYTTEDGTETSYYTVHLYLSDKDHENGKGLLGGATPFSSIDESREIAVRPKVGRVLLFQHRGLYHAGDDVLRGVKYTMRTDLMYTMIGHEAVPDEEEQAKPWSRMKGVFRKSGSK